MEGLDNLLGSVLFVAKTKAQKKEITDKLEGAFKVAASSVFVHFKGVSVADETAMRRSLRSEGVGYTVAKKTLIRRALSALGHDEASLPLEGEIAIAYNSSADGDASGPARLVHGLQRSSRISSLSRAVSLKGNFAMQKRCRR